MTNRSATMVGAATNRIGQGGTASRRRWLVLTALGLAGSLAFSGCQTAQVPQSAGQAAAASEAITLREGDVLKIAFPGAPNLDATQPIRRDGKIVLSFIGEIKAAGLTPAELEKEILKQGGSQLVSKVVTVTVESSSFPVFVSGAVLHPGKIMSDRPITALEACMEAGGFDYSKANLSAVRVIRNEPGGVKNYTVNLKQVLEGQRSTTFYLKPSDIVYVPEKFSWF